MQWGNVELVGEIIDALNRGNVEAMLARIAPDFEWTPLEGVARVCRGHEQVRRYCRGLAQHFRHRAARARAAERARRSRGGRRAWPRPGPGERCRAGHPLLSGMDAALRNGGTDAGIHHSRAGAGGTALRAARGQPASSFSIERSLDAIRPCSDQKIGSLAQTSRPRSENPALERADLPRRAGPTRPFPDLREDGHARGAVRPPGRRLS